MDQLTLPFTSKRPSLYVVTLLKGDDPILSINEKSLGEAEALRRSLVSALQRDPRHPIRWEENPRPTGWYGLKPDHSRGDATVYTIVIETKVTEQP